MERVVLFRNVAAVKPLKDSSCDEGLNARFPRFLAPRGCVEISTYCLDSSITMKINSVTASPICKACSD